MTPKFGTDNENELRDGIESMPELADIRSELLPSPRRSAADDLLDEALRETFPASDPLASGHFE